MKNTQAIINRIISRLPASLKNDAREILECRFLAQKSARETSEFLDIPYERVVYTLSKIREITRGKSPADFA